MGQIRSGEAIGFVRQRNESCGLRLMSPILSKSGTGALIGRRRGQCGGLARLAEQVHVSDMMVDANFRAAHAAKIFLDHIGAAPSSEYAC